MSIETRHTRFRPLLLGVAATWLFLSCVSEPPRTPVAMDPSNPNAQESSPVSVLSSREPAVAAATEEVPKADAGEVYTCPMHPEVIRSAPGRCPICGMALVLRKSAAPTPPRSSALPLQQGTHSADASHP